MNPTDGESAAELLARCDSRELTRILREYGEEPHAFRIAQGILRARERGELPRTTGALVDLIRDVLPAPVQRKMGGHPARRVFQALRIAVNDELGALEDLLDQLPRIVGEGGIAIAIAYHSLEDRIVKRAFRALEAEGRGKSVPRRAIVPSEEEIAENYKARSAKMRVFRFGRLLPQGRGFR
jgi:16S rRNA (cytosine1402-N4)-methyltransferase